MQRLLRRRGNSLASPTHARQDPEASVYLTARNLTKRYGAVVACSDIDFDVGKGEIVGLLGQNGAGKTTLMNAEGLRKAVLAQSQLRVAVLDLAEISAVDAAGLGMLAGLRNWAKTAGKQLKLMNIVPRVEEVLELTKLRSAFEILSVREMMDLLCRAAHPDQAEARAPIHGPALAMAV